jgi:hypothetical protein
MQQRRITWLPQKICPRFSGSIHRRRQSLNAIRAIRSALKVKHIYHPQTRHSQGKPTPLSKAYRKTPPAGKLYRLNRSCDSLDKRRSPCKSTIESANSWLGAGNRSNPDSEGRVKVLSVTENQIIRDSLVTTYRIWDVSRPRWHPDTSSNLQDYASHLAH